MSWGTQSSNKLNVTESAEFFVHIVHFTMIRISFFGFWNQTATSGSIESLELEIW
jgi:hypothetical protein